MKYILLGLVVFVLLFLIPLLLGLLSKLTKKQIVLVYTSIAIILGLVGFFTYIQGGMSDRNTDIMRAFERGDSLECKGVEVANDRYNLVSGTLAFVGKKGSKNENTIISVEDCVVK